jgi:hypothetical protein
VATFGKDFEITKGHASDEKTQHLDLAFDEESSTDWEGFLKQLAALETEWREEGMYLL